ncbi:hypothetical protein SteCoe_18442 [Stentor coeruleus]|uniref:Cullin family profile domain-containing protein n=1 Tax=Stentor coeruleus TaxID=5963 RepID=A0A1R2BWQ3_9CILI|nr:hypothetical protein SteCoe_18442 [Stentor coeruleus]
MEIIEHEINKIKPFIDSILANLDTETDIKVSESELVNASNTVLYLNDMGDKSKILYFYYKTTITEYTKKIVKTELLQLRGLELLKKVILRWQKHIMLIYYLHRIFIELDRSFVDKSNLPKLCLAGISIFRSEVYDEMKVNIKDALFEQINIDLYGGHMDVNTITKVLIFLIQLKCKNFTIERNKFKTFILMHEKHDLDLYCNEFESTFLDKIKDFYSSKSTEWILSMTYLEYFNVVNKALEKEKYRSQVYLYPCTKDPLIKIVINELIIKNDKIKIEDILKHNKHDELNLIFSILKTHEFSLDSITNKFSNYVENCGDLIVNDQMLHDDAIEFTRRLLSFNTEIEIIIKNYPLFRRSKEIGFQKFMSKYPYSAQYIASYCDYEMKKGLKGVTEQESELRLNSLINLIVCCYDKDVFFRYYTTFLAKRLLNETSLNDEAEQYMISKLKVECGHGIVSKISNMYQDKVLSGQIMKEFKTLLHKGQPNGILLNIQVLRSGCWPKQIQEPFNLPNELKNCFYKFQMFYQDKYEGRTLNILPFYGNCEISIIFCNKPFTCIVNTYQASIILWFNSADTLTLCQIREYTRLNAFTFNPRQKLFIKQSLGKTITENDTICLNFEFNCSSLKVNFLPKKAIKTEVPNKEDDKTVENERKYILESLIVKIAKWRKQIKHEELVSEVIRHATNFKPQLPMIKVQIENLIIREFLVRDENEYIYNP